MKKLRQGFTILEMLCATVVLVLLSALLVTGVQLAARTYSATLAASEARALCATLTSAIQRELRYAGDTVGKEDPIYFSQSCGTECSLVVTDGRVRLQTGEGQRELISPDAYTWGNRAHLEVAYQESIFTVTLEVTGQNGEVLARNRFQVKRLGGAV